VGLKEGNRMSGKNGDRARFDRQRKAKMHNRTQIRELRKTIKTQETTSSQNTGGRKSTIESTGRGA
jgi:hypothetical protein